MKTTSNRREGNGFIQRECRGILTLVYKRAQAHKILEWGEQLRSEATRLGESPIRIKFT